MPSFDKLFCTRSRSTSRKSSAHYQNNNRQNEAMQQTTDSNNNNAHHRQQTQQHTQDVGSNNMQHTNPTPNIPCRYVTAEFHAVEQDELTVHPGEIVLFEFADVVDGKSWSHVLRLTRNERGFVPSDILSTEPKQSTQCIKKKLPRSMPVDPSTDTHPHNQHNHSQHQNHHQHLHDGPRSHKTHCTSERTCHSQGGSIKLHHQQTTHHLRTGEQVTTPQFDLAANSLQGSSGCQTFQKYPNFSPFNQPPSYYYNLNGPHPAGPRYDEFRPFHILPYHKMSIGYRFVVMHNFVAREENDLEVKPGDYVVVLNNEDKDWYWVRREYDDHVGFVPSRFICPFEQVQSVLNKGNSTLTMKSSNQLDVHTYFNQPEPEILANDCQEIVR